MVQNNAQQHGEGALDDPRGQAMRDAMWKGHAGFELALVPVFFALVGWVIDGSLGITPVLTIVLAIVGLGGAVANQYYRYVDSMEAATAQRLARSQTSVDVHSAQDAQPFGAVAPTEVDMSIDFSKRPTFDPEAAL